LQKPVELDEGRDAFMDRRLADLCSEQAETKGANTDLTSHLIVPGCFLEIARSESDARDPCSRGWPQIIRAAETPMIGWLFAGFAD